MVDDGHTVVDALIDVSHVGHAVDGVIVIDIRYLNNSDARIGDIHVLNVPRAGAIPGHVNFTRRQREPPDRRGTDADAESADECNESRRIHRTNCDRARNPAPTASHKSPTAIVKWSEAPRLIFDPSPSPGIDISPMAIAIRGPVYSDASGIPDMSIIGVGFPTAVLIHVFVAGHVVRDILAALGSILALIARKAPLCK
jgi:hypothetical protein